MIQVRVLSETGERFAAAMGAAFHAVAEDGETSLLPLSAPAPRRAAVARAARVTECTDEICSCTRRGRRPAPRGGSRRGMLVSGAAGGELILTTRARALHWIIEKRNRLIIYLRRIAPAARAGAAGASSGLQCLLRYQRSSTRLLLRGDTHCVR